MKYLPLTPATLASTVVGHAAENAWLPFAFPRLTDLVLKNTRIYAGAWVFDRSSQPDDGAMELVPFFDKADWADKALADHEQSLLDDATRAWHGLRGAGAPARSADFKEYVEDVLKPMFFAQTLGFESAEALPERPSPSYEEMARRMGCDAATVKNQLTRYLELRRGRGG